MTDAKVKFGSLSLNNQYQVHFAGINGAVINFLRYDKRIDNAQDFISREAGILCNDASLPATAYATAEVKDNFMGIPQQFAHTRIYTDIDFTFYVDEKYTLLKIFEGWMEYISSGANPVMEQQTKSFYRRMRYPDSYKCNTLYINKFEKDFKRTMRYQFINAFPKSMSSVPVSYGAAEILKVTVSFNYDRYIVRG